jgi:hypothetical protein
VICQYFGESLECHNETYFQTLNSPLGYESVALHPSWLGKYTSLGGALSSPRQAIDVGHSSPNYRKFVREMRGWLVNLCVLGYNTGERGEILPPFWLRVCHGF